MLGLLHGENTPFTIMLSNMKLVCTNSPSRLKHSTAQIVYTIPRTLDWKLDKNNFSDFGFGVGGFYIFYDGHIFFTNMIDKFRHYSCVVVKLFEGKFSTSNQAMQKKSFH